MSKEVRNNLSTPGDRLLMLLIMYRSSQAIHDLLWRMGSFFIRHGISYNTVAVNVIAALLVRSLIM